MPPDMSVWLGRTDVAEGPQALRWHQCVRPWGPGAPPGIVLLGFACDEGVRRNQGRPGAAAGPRALRQALANLAWHQQRAVYDAGDVACPDDDLEAAQHHLAAVVARVLSAGHAPLVLGGGHETAFGTFLGIAQAARPARLGIISCDAHFDVRSADRATSGTPFAQMAEWCGQHGQPFRYFCLGIAEPGNTAALFERADALGVQWRFDTDLAPWRLAEPLAALDAFARDVDALYLSVDLDVLPAATMPAVSAPAARGVSLEAVEAIIAAVLATDKTAAVDIVEFNPAFDRDGNAVRVAGRIVWQIARHWLT